MYLLGPVFFPKRVGNGSSGYQKDSRNRGKPMGRHQSVNYSSRSFQALDEDEIKLNRGRHPGYESHASSSNEGANFGVVGSGIRVTKVIEVMRT